MLIDSLSNINLHDSELVNVIIENPRSRLIMHLLYVEDYKTMRTSQKRLVFSGCMKALIDLNLGVLTPDSLRTGHEIEQSAIIDELKKKFDAVGIPLAVNLRHFYLETNSTTSTFHIIAESAALEDT